MSVYDFTKEEISMDVLQQSIADNEIVDEDLLHLEWIDPDQLSVVFGSDLGGSALSALSAIVSNHIGGNGILRNKNYFVNKYDDENVKVEKKIWYETKNEDNTYSDIASEIEFDWDDFVLMGYTERVYCTNGALYTETLYICLVNTDGDEIIEEV